MKRAGRIAAALLIGITLPGNAAMARDRSDPLHTAGGAPALPSRPFDYAAGADPCASSRTVPARVTLVDAIDLALCNNPQTRQSWASAKAAAAQVGVARSAYLPSLDASVALSRSDRYENGSSDRNELTGSLSFNYLLFDFGGRDAVLESARQALLAADWTHNATLQSVLQNAIQSYYLYFAAREAVDATVAAEKSSLQSLETARARLKAGNATRADVLQAQTAYSQARLNRTRAEGEAAKARGVLANALGLRANVALTLAPPPDIQAQALAERAVGELVDTAHTTRPELAAAQAQVKVAQANVKVAQAAGKPSLSLFGNVGAAQTSPGTDPRFSAIGVQLSIPLFTGYRNTYQIQAAKQQLEAQIAQRDQLENDVGLDVWRNYQELRTQGQSLETSADLAASAQESYNVALGRYKAGVGTVTDLLNAQTSLANANVQRIQARYSWNVAKVGLARALGTLDPDFALESARRSQPSGQP